MSPPNDPAESEAERLASAGLASFAGIPALDGVRLHTGSGAAAAAAALNARAFTAGRDIVFGAGQFAPGTREGRDLLAHELSHVLSGSLSRLYRRPYGPDIDDHPPPADPAATPDLQDQYTFVLEVPNPNLDPSKARREDDKQKIAIHTPKDGPPCHLHFYAVPVAKLKPAASAPGTPAAPPPLPAPAPAPAAGPPPSTTPAAPPPVPAHPNYPPGSTATTLDGATLRVLASTPEHVITAEYTKFAVGAASTSAVRFEGGTAMIIDAGINNAGLGITEKALAKLTLDKLAEFIGDRAVREFLVSHAHGDHVSLAPDILRRFPVDVIRINSVMTRWPGYLELRKAMVAAQAERISVARAKFAGDMEAMRPEWLEKTGRQFAQEQRQIEWEKHIDAEFQRRTGEIPGAAKATERVLVQAKSNVLDVFERDLAPGRERGESKGDPEKVEFGVEDPFRIYEIQAPIKNKRVLDQRKSTKDSDIDVNASSYVIELPSGVRLIVAPDLRANDLKRVMERFGRVWELLKMKPARVQMWDITHHMQKGFTNNAVSARQFAKVVDFLYAFHARRGTDIVVVSAQADLSKPGAPTLVDPANIWLLRSLGFDPYLATSGRDVRVIDIFTSQGNKATGVIGARAPGTGPRELSVKRAKMALEQLNSELQTLRLAAPESAKKKRGKKAAAPAPSADEIAAGQARTARVAELEALRSEVTKAYEAALKEIAELSRPPSGQKTHTSQSLDDVTQREFPKQKALDELLERNNFDRPQLTDLRLTEMALVVLRQDIGTEVPEPGSAAARARQLAVSRTRLLELEARVKGGEVGTGIQTELLMELTQYRQILNGELNPADPARPPLEGTSRTVLADEMKSVDAKLEKLGATETQVQFKREVETGILAEQQITVVKPAAEPSRAVKATGEALEVLGRGLGLVMVVTTVHGQVDLIDKLKKKQANVAEGVLGTVHNVAAGVVGVRMVRGLHVGLGSMAVLSVLDIGQAIARDYETKEQRNIEIAYSAISNSINLGLMLAGQAIAKIPHPVTMIAGTLIAFAGPVIMEKLGLHAWLERKLEFDPESVTQVKQSLRELMKSYRTVIGSIELTQRTIDENDSSVVGSRKEIAAEAKKTIRKYRFQAAGLEREITEEFATAYGEAREAHSGLKDLDSYRAGFMAMRHRAGMTDATVLADIESDYRKTIMGDWGDPGLMERTGYGFVLAPDEVDRQFAEMDAKLSMENYSAQQASQLGQWYQFDSELDELEDELGNPKDEDFEKDFMEHQRKIQVMIDNANYRLNPRGQGTYRSTPMLSSGSPGYAAYVDALREVQARFVHLQHKYVVALRARTGAELAEADLLDDPGAPVPRAVSFEAVMQLAESSLAAYNLDIDSGPAPPEALARAVLVDSDGTRRYREYVKEHGDYAAELRALKGAAAITDSLLEQARHMIAAEEVESQREAQRSRHAKAEMGMRAAESRRTDKLGKYFDSELDTLRGAALKREVAAVLPLFGAQGSVKPITEEEQTALIENEDFGEPGENVLPPLATRLQMVEGGPSLDEHGNIHGVYRLVGRVLIRAGQAGAPARPISSEANALVGVLRPAGMMTNEAHMEVDYVTVLPLNQAAIDFFGGYLIRNVPMENLVPANVDNLKYRQEHPGP